MGHEAEAEVPALLEREEGTEEAEGGKGQNALPFESADFPDSFIL